MTRNMIISEVTVTVHGDISNEELAIYLDEYQAKRKSVMTRAVVTVEGQNIGINGYDANGEPFERYRRITGYLTGKLSGWNDAKRSEEKDRVKHGIGVERNG
jgi:hypothetical protein